MKSKFIEKTKETWREELTTKRKSLTEVKVQSGIFQGDSLLLFVIAMMPLNHLLRKCTTGYKLSILKESKKKDKYLNLASELKNLWNMKVTVIPIVIGALSTVTKDSIDGLEDLEITGWVETIQTTHLSGKILHYPLIPSWPSIYIHGWLQG